MLENNVKKIFWLFAIMIIANSIYFTYVNAFPMVRNDGWRFIGLYLEPWYQGVFDWRTLWLDHHPQPITGLLFIANAEWFGLNMKYEALFSLAFAPLLTITMLARIKKSFEDNTAPLYHGLALLVVCFTFSLTSGPVYLWSLVTKGFITVFVAVLAAIIIDINHSQRPNAISASIVLVVFSTFLILFGDSATIFLMSCLGVLTINFCLSPDKKTLIWVLILVTSKLLHAEFIDFIGVESRYQAKVPAEVLSHIGAYISYVGVGLFSAWVNLKSLVRIGVPVEIIPYFGVATLLIYILALYVYFLKGMSKITILPGVFMFVSMITAIAGAVFRFNPESWAPLSGFVPRYYLQYFLAVIGMLWIFFYHFSILEGNAVRRYSPYILTVTLVLVQIGSALAAWNSSPYIQKATVKTYQAMHKNVTGDFSEIPAGYLLGNNYPEPYKRGLAFLKEHDLNIFSVRANN